MKDSKTLIYGSNVKYYMFENLVPSTALVIKDEILRVLNKYEPRIDNVAVSVHLNLDENRFDVDISFNIINLKIPAEVSLFLERLR